MVGFLAGSGLTAVTRLVSLKETIQSPITLASLQIIEVAVQRKWIGAISTPLSRRSYMLITSHSRRSVLAAIKGVIVAFALAACQNTTEDNANRLTAEQVRSTFIDREWSNGSGSFMFSKDGSYQYGGSGSAFGTYQIGDDGVLCTSNAMPRPGQRTCYTFYRYGNGYRYWHDRSAQFFPVFLR
jgi:hypothetical protein